MTSKPGQILREIDKLDTSIRKLINTRNFLIKIYLSMDSKAGRKARVIKEKV